MSEEGLETAVVETVPIIDAVFNSAEDGRSLALPVEFSAKALIELLEEIAEHELNHETDEDSPWYTGEHASQHQVNRAAQLWQQARENKVNEQLYRLGNVINAAKVLHSIRVSENNAVWLDEENKWQSLQDRLADAVPETRSSGSARQIAAFVEGTTKTWLNYGIEPEEIAACYREGENRMLGYVSTWARLIERSPRLIIKGKMHKMTGEKREEEHRWLCSTAATVEHGIDLDREARRRYQNPDKPPPPKILYEMQQHGIVVQLAAQMDVELKEMFLRRLNGKLERAPAGTLYMGVSPHMVLQALPESGEWSQPQCQLMRAIVLSSHARATVLGILEANEGKWVDLDFLQNAAQGTAYRHDLGRSAGELTMLLRDGIHCYAEETVDDDLRKVWRLCTS